MKDFLTNMFIYTIIYCIGIFAIATVIIVVFVVYAAIILNHWLPISVLTLGVLSTGIIVYSIKALQKI